MNKIGGIIVKVQRSLFPKGEICIYSKDKKDLCITGEPKTIEYINGLIEESKFKTYFIATISNKKFNLIRELDCKEWPDW